MAARCAGATGAGIVDSHVQPVEARNGLVDHIAYVVFVTHVCQNESGFTAEATKLDFDRLAFGLAASGHNDRCAFFGKGERRGTTDAGQSAGNEDNRSTHSRGPLNLAAVDNGFELSFIEAAATGRRANLPRPDMIN
jgi:hypothetical protein